MKRIFTGLFLLALSGLWAQSAPSQSFIDTRCAELSSDEARAEVELKRIRREKALLGSQRIELQLKLYQQELTDLELVKSAQIAQIEAEYLRKRGVILAKITTVTTVTQPVCAQ
jgi:hypothetical protein